MGREVEFNQVRNDNSCDFKRIYKTERQMTRVFDRFDRLQYDIKIPSFFFRASASNHIGSIKQRALKLIFFSILHMRVVYERPTSPILAPGLQVPKFF